MASSTDATSQELLQIEAAAAAKGLPRIDEANASQHKPEDLRLFQDAGERARLDAPPHNSDKMQRLSCVSKMLLTLYSWVPALALLHELQRGLSGE